jgi:hypothetical protein
VTYGAERLHKEVSYMAFHLHWPLNELLDLEHADRRRYVGLIENLATRQKSER